MDRLEQVVLDALFRLPVQSQDLELIMEAVQYTLEEIRDLNLKLENDEKIREEIASTGSLTLSVIESHPLYGIIQQVCEEMLGIEKSEAVMITSNILDSFYAHTSPNDANQEQEEKRQRRGILGECEMCERSMMLTEQ